jgi:hypothetical protein
MASRLDDDLIRFIRTHLGSVWALELMLTMMRQPDRAWTIDALVRQLRATDALIGGLLDRFQRAGLAARTGDDHWTWRPASPDLGELCRRTAEAHAATPFAVIQTIAEAPAQSLVEFANAFRLRRDKGKP